MEIAIQSDGTNNVFPRIVKRTGWLEPKKTDFIKLIRKGTGWMETRRRNCVPEDFGEATGWTMSLDRIPFKLRWSPEKPKYYNSMTCDFLMNWVAINWIAMTYVSGNPSNCLQQIFFRMHACYRPKWAQSAVRIPVVALRQSSIQKSRAPFVRRTDAASSNTLPKLLVNSNSTKLQRFEFVKTFCHSFYVFASTFERR